MKPAGYTESHQPSKPVEACESTTRGVRFSCPTDGLAEPLEVEGSANPHESAPTSPDIITTPRDDLRSIVWRGSLVYLEKHPGPVFEDALRPVLDVLREKAEAGVYFLLRGGRVIYVGQSSNVPNRLKWHRWNKRNPASGELLHDSVRVFPLPPEYREDLESAFIHHLRPPLNWRDSVVVGSETIETPLTARDAHLLRALGFGGVRAPRSRFGGAGRHAPPRDLLTHVEQLRRGGR